MKKLDKLNYVKQAEKVIESMEKKGDKIKLTTNKIRTMLTLINELYSMAKKQPGKTISDDIQTHIQYIKMKLIYEGGRDKFAKELLQKSDIIEYMDSIGESNEELILVCHYMEALVAYHKFNTAEEN